MLLLYGKHNENIMFYKIIKGCKIKMDDSGNILIKRIAKTNVFVKSTEITTGQVSNNLTQKKRNHY